jgi:hypothetical protein
MTQARAWQTLDEAVSGNSIDRPNTSILDGVFKIARFWDQNAGSGSATRKIGIAATCAAGGRAGCNQADRTGRFSGGSQRDGYCPGAAWL